MNTTKEELQERAQLVRIHEANCRIEYPSKDEANFRLAIMKRIGLQFALKELRQAQVDGPVTNTAPPPVRAGAGSVRRVQEAARRLLGSVGRVVCRTKQEAQGSS